MRTILLIAILAVTSVSSFAAPKPRPVAKPTRPIISFPRPTPHPIGGIGW